MKKFVAVSTILALVAAIFVSCASEPAEKAPAAPVAKPIIGLEGVPSPSGSTRPRRARTPFMPSVTR